MVAVKWALVAGQKRARRKIKNKQKSFGILLSTLTLKVFFKIY